MNRRRRKLCLKIPRRPNAPQTNKRFAWLATRYAHLSVHYGKRIVPCCCRGKYLTLREHGVSFRKLSEDVAFALQFSECVAGRLLGELKYSKSQIRQDLFVLTTLQFKRDRFFVEFGAADGWN